jgi:hypothetical protein
MKWAIILILITALVYVFVQSETLEVRQVDTAKNEGGFDVAGLHRSEYTFHWDRFFRYLETIPTRVTTFFQRLTSGGS